MKNLRQWLESFILSKYKTQFKKVNVMYEWKKGKMIKLRDSLQDFSIDEEYLDLYLGFMDALNIKDITGLDSQVRYIVIKVQEWINAKDKDYKADRAENWLSPQESFDTYVIDEDVGDCEDASTLIYGCIVAKLIQQERWEENKHKLLRVDVKITGGVSHALLAWLRDDNITWSPIESTFYEDRFSKLWQFKKDIFKSIYLDVWHIFDEESEYKLK